MDRAVLKISGEGFGGKTPLDKESLSHLVEQISTAKEQTDVELSIVVGGGNHIRGADQEFVPRRTADLAGMTGTIINGLVLQACLRQVGFDVLLQSALQVERIANPIDIDQAHDFLVEGGLVIFAAGTGNPFFTTDSAAALRAGELDADIVLKGTQVDGVYTGDPLQEKHAQRLEELTYTELIDEQLGVIDQTAAQLCRGLDLPMVIFDLYQNSSVSKTLQGEQIGTLLHN